ncbi:hypothetical protein GCM10008992_26310 [Halorubrum aquaticum]|nr:hypothetical protein [Halorubrum aquaticum]
MSDDVTVLEDEIEAYADVTVARVRVLSVPTSDRFEDGIKYAYHYSEAGADDPITDSTTTTASTNSTSAVRSSRSTTPALRRSSAPGGRRSQKRSATTGSPFKYGD